MLKALILQDDQSFLVKQSYIILQIIYLFYNTFERKNMARGISKRTLATLVVHVSPRSQANPSR